MYIDTCVAGQTKALKNWTKWKRRFCRQEIALCDKLGKTDGRLRFNTTSKLPILQDHKDESRGPESDFPQTTQRQRFFESDAFFKIAERPFEDDSLVTSLTWTERKLYKPPLTVVEHGLDTEGSPLTAENRAKAYSPHTADCVRPLLGMYVTGHQLGKQQQQQEEGEEEGEGEEEEEASLNTGDAGDESRSVSSCYPAPPDKPESPWLRPTDSPTWSKPCLQVADKIYAWNEPCPEGLIEIGMASLEGLRKRSYLLLANLSSVIIRYTWRYILPTDTYKKKRYLSSPITSTGLTETLFPFEKTWLMIQFKADSPGKWEEQWRLTTKPRLEPEGGIPISLWCMKVDIDRSHFVHQQLESRMEKTAVQRLISRIVYDLVSFLPITSAIRRVQLATERVERSLQPEDVLLFEQKHPDLFYHSETMFHLFDMQTQLEGFRKCDETGEAYTRFLARYRDELEPMEEDVAEERDEREDSQEREAEDEKEASVYAEGGEYSAYYRPAPRLEVYGKERASISVRQLYRDVTQLDDAFPFKVAMMERVNKVIANMAWSHDRPVEVSSKYIHCRPLLARALDRVALEEWRLRRTLDLLDDKIATLLATFPGGEEEPEEELERGIELELELEPEHEQEPEAEPETSDSEWRRDRSLPSCRQLSSAYLGHIMEETAHETFMDTAHAMSVTLNAKREMARARRPVMLYGIIYNILAAMIESIHPLMNPDGIELNPFKPEE
nr:hypothetical protein BaRGS_004984 [Batillaria attramentaria]